MVKADLSSFTLTSAYPKYLNSVTFFTSTPSDLTILPPSHSLTHIFCLVSNETLFPPLHVMPPHLWTFLLLLPALTSGQGPPIHQHSSTAHLTIVLLTSCNTLHTLTLHPQTIHKFLSQHLVTFFL